AGVGGLTLGGGVTYSGLGGLTLGGGVALFGLVGFTLGGGVTYAGAYEAKSPDFDPFLIIKLRTRKRSNSSDINWIEDEIYSTVDACQIAQEMWEAIERLQQGESLNIQDVKTNLFWEFGKFTSHDGKTMESYYTRFYKLMNEMIRNNLSVATMQVNVQFLHQLQPEWSRLARNANPVALVATAQANQDPYYQTSKSHKPYAPSSKPSIPNRTHTTTRCKGKEIAKPITPPSETASEEDSDPEQAPRDKDMQKNLALIAKTVNVVGASENVGSPVVQQSGI
nr:hypothetical protein [Tanacetum cinerariifolium]